MLCKLQAMMIMVLGMKFQVQLEGFLRIKVQYHHDNICLLGNKLAVITN